MTVSLIAVFIPILLMGGTIGRLFFEFAVTLSTAILISGFASISLTPMLCSRILSAHDTGSAAGGMQVEGLRQMQGRFVQRQTVNGGPQVQDVALSRTICLKALAHIFAEVNREGALAIGGLAMHGTRAAALLTMQPSWPDRR